MPFSIVELDEEMESHTLCTIITPFGKYKYTHLHKCQNCSPGIAQAVIESVLTGIDVTHMCIDDVGAFSSSWYHHTELLQTLLCCLSENDLQLTLSNVNRLSKKWIGLVIGFLVWS